MRYWDLDFFDEREDNKEIRMKALMIATVLLGDKAKECAKEFAQNQDEKALMPIFYLADKFVQYVLLRRANDNAMELMRGRRKGFDDGWEFFD